METIMAENGKADLRKITGAVEDAVTYPILTRDVTSQPSDSTGVSGPSGGASLDSIAQSTIRQLLGWRYRADDTTGFLAALTKTIQLKEVEGHIKWVIQPQTYMVQADLGEVTGAQASIYARAKVALDQSLPLLNGLTLLGVPVADPEDMEATRAIIQTEFTALVNELGVVGGPRVQRVDSFFSQLLGPHPIPSTPPANGQLGTLATRFGLLRTNVNTIDDEQDFTNYLILYDYIYSLHQTWHNQRGYFTGRGPDEPYLGTQLVLISQALDALEESVQEAYDAMDSVFFGASDRQATELHFFHQPLITVYDLFSWVEDFATSEGLQLVQEGGKDGVLAFRSILNQLEYLMFLAMKESRAHSNNPVHGFHTSRVHRALDNIAKFLELTEREANKIQRDNAPVLEIKGKVQHYFDPHTDTLRITINGENILPNASVFLIDSNDPKKGFKGQVQPVGSPPVILPVTSIDAMFSFTDSVLGRYIVVVRNPDGQYAWLEEAFTTMVCAPSVVAMTQNDALAAITGAQLAVGSVTYSDAPLTAGLVLRQDPPSESSVAHGSQVNLVISSGPPMVSVPSVVGYAQTDAINKIAGAQLAVGTVTPADSATVSRGNVISHYPTSGTFVMEGFPVNLVISSGPLTVSNVIGMTQNDAITAITGAQLSVGTITTAYHATVASGHVIIQYPASGSSVAQGSLVNLVISSGPLTVPDVTTKTETVATKMITSANLTVGTVTREHNDTVARGHVISQHPTSGTSVAEGYQVNLVISSGPPK
jgi:beta-lactam-binding protein with PASTA domain